MFMETELAALAVGVLTGAATGLGQETVAAVVRMVRESLAATPRGQAALAGVDAAPGDDGARREAEAVLREALRADHGLQQTLATHLNVAPTRMTNVVMVNGTRMRGSQVSLGPITLHKPNTTAGLLGLAASLVVVAALLVYGVLQLAGGGPGNDGKGGARARALSAAEALRMLPGVTDLPGAWETSRAADVETNVNTKCHNAEAEFESEEQDASGFRDLRVRYSAYACPDLATATTGFAALTKEGRNPADRKETVFPSRTLGDQSATSSYEVKDEFLAAPGDVGSYLTWRAQVGMVVIEMHYGPARDGVGSERQAEELMRIMCDRAREAQTQG
ncbi:hypothetical protein ABZ615_18315 [Streptomyces sp. NPDC007325]|uniref:hypothetical protein n=1 Tax=Streptomyces sp. NPDC007325 TaxID=3154588 RepID=UPI0033D80D71